MTAYVFVGPTLPVDQAARLLDAVYLPPAAQGDVYRVAQQRPAAIGIIDGYFERVPSVWHKGILWVLAQGIPVFGAASMGALRAAELDAFGMRGCGTIYEWFRDGVLEDDDEVAVTHGPAGTAFRAVSDAMVNIRATLASATAAGILSPDDRDELLLRAKALYYADRSYARLLADAKRSGIDPTVLETLRRWLPAGRVDQKRADALTMLRTLRASLLTGTVSAPPTFYFETTEFWEQAIAD